MSANAYASLQPTLGQPPPSAIWDQHRLRTCSASANARSAQPARDTWCHLLAHSFSLTHTHTCTCSCSCTHLSSPRAMLGVTHSLTLSLSQTHTHTHTRTCTHTHTHTCPAPSLRRASGFHEQDKQVQTARNFHGASPSSISHFCCCLAHGLPCSTHSV